METVQSPPPLTTFPQFTKSFVPSKATWAYPLGRVVGFTPLALVKGTAKFVNAPLLSPVVRLTAGYETRLYQVDTPSLLGKQRYQATKFALSGLRVLTRCA